MKKTCFAVGAKVKLSPLQRIIQKTGRRPTECKCHLCKMQCHTPCLGTPQDILRLIDAGYADRLKPTLWEAGVLMGVVSEPVPLIQAECLDGACGGLLDIGAGSHCTFYTKDGLCELHDLGLKPTEGRLSHHSIRLENFKRNKSISWAVIQEWLDPENLPVIEEIARKYSEHQKQSEHSARPQRVSESEETDGEQRCQVERRQGGRLRLRPCRRGAGEATGRRLEREPPEGG